MKTNKFDFKSLMIGFLLAILLLTTMGAKLHSDTDDDYEVGRYQVSSHIGVDIEGKEEMKVFIIDTKYGDVEIFSDAGSNAKKLRHIDEEYTFRNRHYSYRGYHRISFRD